MPDKGNRRRFGIIGGLGALGAADVLCKLVRALPTGSGTEQPEILFEQHPFREVENPGERRVSQNGRKIYVFDMVSRFAERRVDTVVLPCFISHTFLDEIEAETTLHIVNLMEALREYLTQRHPGVRRLGILTSDYVRSRGLFERYFPEEMWSLDYPGEELQRECVMPAIYGPQGIKAGSLHGPAVDGLARAGLDLVQRGAELNAPWFWAFQSYHRMPKLRITTPPGVPNLYRQSRGSADGLSAFQTWLCCGRWTSIEVITCPYRPLRSQHRPPCPCLHLRCPLGLHPQRRPCLQD